LRKLVVVGDYFFIERSAHAVDVTCFIYESKDLAFIEWLKKVFVDATLIDSG